MNGVSIQRSVSEIESSIIMDNTNTARDGMLKWRITDVNALFQLQKTTPNVSQQSIVSDRFQTPDGYEFRLRAFLNGCGRGRNTHCSLFIQMCKTDFDEILDYPFADIISFKVLDQTQGKPKRHHQQNFRTNVSASFLKPEGDFCPENGLATFISHDALFKEDPESPAYVKNDTLFIEAATVIPKAVPMPAGATS